MGGIKLLEVPVVFLCRIVGRLNRFVVRVRVHGREAEAYLNNTGRLEELIRAGRWAYCTVGSGDLPYRLFAVREEEFGSIVDTRMQAESFEAALVKNLLPAFRGCRIIGRNVRLGDSLIDYELEGKNRMLVELKSAVLRLDSMGSYPDCQTARGRKHVARLIEHASSGGKASVFFISSLPGIKGIKPNRTADQELVC